MRHPPQCDPVVADGQTVLAAQAANQPLDVRGKMGNADDACAGAALTLQLRLAGDMVSRS
jgi:hypothetical protein